MILRASSPLPACTTFSLARSRRRAFDPRIRSNGGRSRPEDKNSVIKAARALAARVDGLRMGAFRLVKRLPAAAGVGGGSSDAAAALRLLARHNALSLDDPRVIAAAQETGSDVPVCLVPRARMMSGRGEIVGPALGLPPVFAVMVNPASRSRRQRCSRRSA